MRLNLHNPDSNGYCQGDEDDAVPLPFRPPPYNSPLLTSVQAPVRRGCLACRAPTTLLYRVLQRDRGCAVRRPHPSLRSQRPMGEETGRKHRRLDPTLVNVAD
jgi:hypothetical protein